MASSVAAPSTAVAVAAPWSRFERILFRFAFVYWALYLFPQPGAATLLDLLPWGADKLNGWMGAPFGHLAHFVGRHVFYLSGEAAEWHPTGSGDTALLWVSALNSLVLAAVASAVWSAIAERRGRRAEYRTAYAWLRLLLRFLLATTLLGYGFAKVFPSQFGLEPRLTELTETYGESSPMHVLWFFMGVSRPYTIFGGLMEVIPGMLLLFRRTSTLGLMGAAAVMANVVALNFCYDVPVKLYSMHLLAMSLFLLLPDAEPMLRFFWGRQAAQLTGVWVPRFERRPLRVGAHVLQGLVVLSCAVGAVQAYRSREVRAPPLPIRGMWAVDHATGFPADARMVFESRRSVQMSTGWGPRTGMPATLDAASRTIKFTKMEKPGVLTWEMASPRQMTLTGTWNGAPATATLHRTDPESFPLTSRGFHWVQEYPYNR